MNECRIVANVACDAACVSCTNSKDCSMFWCVAGSHPYFSGGYITQVHGRDDFDAIQVETPRDLRIERGEEGRERFGHALGRAICDFYNFHYVNK